MEKIETILQIKDLCFSYSNDEQYTIENFSLDIEKGKFTSILGPSGCGKTTLLRLISGFLQPQNGSIVIDGINQKKIEPNQRKIGMVFQDYALFPHMTVFANICYGLKINKTRVISINKIKQQKKEITSKAFEIAEILGLKDLLQRYPHELSGGQQQRVALARVLVLNPTLLLMDEPLSSLDKKLREKVQQELKDIQNKLKITTIYVTHDQEEALALSDKIAVINEGKLQQYGTPRECYFKPQNIFTADFIGKVNYCNINDEKFIVRPEWVELNKTTKQGDVEGIVTSCTFLGERTRFTIQEEKGIFIADLPTLESNFLEEGRVVSLNIIHKWRVE